VDETEMRRRVKARADAAIARHFAKRGIELALSSVPADVGDELLCALIVERCPDMFTDLEVLPADRLALPLEEWMLEYVSLRARGTA
jgi:hypothetical protein